MILAGGIFGIHNHTAGLVADLAVVVLGVIWLALVYWTWADARRRMEDQILVACATVAALIPYLGTLVYAIVRPPEFVEDVRERELEMQASEARLGQISMHTCPHCDFAVEHDFLRCPNCLRKLRDPCANCGRPLAPDWKICPYCETDRGIDPALVRRTRRARHDPRPTMVTPPPPDFI